MVDDNLLKKADNLGLQVEDVIERILTLEKSSCLLDLEMDGVQIYPFLRMSIYYELVKQLGIFTSNQADNNNISRIHRFKEHISNGVLLRELVAKRRDCEILAIESGRRGKETNKNIYLGYFLDALQHNYYCVRNADLHDGYSTAEIKDKRTIFFEYYRLKGYLHRWFFISKELRKKIIQLSKKINQHFEEEFTSKIDLKSFIESFLENLVGRLSVSHNLIRGLDPKLVVVQCAYDHAPLVHSAKKRKIPVVELQHGTIYRHHLGYTYPQVSNDTIEIFPDYIFTFGEFWSQSALFPIAQERIIPVGFPHFERKKKRQNRKPRREKQILFLSQNVIGNLLLELALDVASLLPDYQIIYKLHPKQYPGINNIQRLIPPDLKHNFSLFGADSPPLYDLFSESAYQVGVFSTSIYECIGYAGTPTIICKLPGWKFSKHLIDSGYATFAENGRQIVDIIINGKARPIADKQAFFKDNALSVMLENIDRLLNRTN